MASARWRRWRAAPVRGRRWRWCAASANWPTIALMASAGHSLKSKDAGKKRRRATAGRRLRVLGHRRRRRPQPREPWRKRGVRDRFGGVAVCPRRCAARPRRSRAALTPACRATAAVGVAREGRRRPSSAAGRAAASFSARRPRSARHAPGARGPLGLVVEAPARTVATAASLIRRPRRA